MVSCLDLALILEDFVNTALLIKLACLGALLGIGKAYASKPPASELDKYFKAYADDPKLAKAVGMVESNLNPNALGDGGKAFGVMQIWYPTAQGHGYSGPSYGLFNPDVNIYYATKELNHLVRRYGMDKGIMGYNVGETKLRKGISNPTYLNKVLTQYGRITI